jgi:hypothetical protein
MPFQGLGQNSFARSCLIIRPRSFKDLDPSFRLEPEAPRAVEYLS